MNERAAGGRLINSILICDLYYTTYKLWMEEQQGAKVISSILICDPHHTTYSLLIEEQQEVGWSAAFSFVIHIKPLTSYGCKSSRGQTDQQHYYLWSISDHLLSMNGRAAGGKLINSILICNLHYLPTMNVKVAGGRLISTILICDPHQTTYLLWIEE